MIKISSDAGSIGPFWWINQQPDIYDFSNNPWSSFLTRVVGSCGFGRLMVLKLEPVSDWELFGDRS